MAIGWEMGMLPAVRKLNRYSNFDDSVAGRKNIVIVKDKHSSFAEHVTALLDITEYVEPDEHEMLFIEYNRNLKSDISSIVANHPDSRVLWDESGTCTDAVFPIDAIVPKRIESRVNGKGIYIAEPHFEVGKLTDERLAWMEQALQIGARNVVFDSMRPQGADIELSVALDDDNTCELIKGVTFESCCPEFRDVPRIWCDETQSREAAELVLGGWIEADERWQMLAHIVSKYQDCFTIWSKALYQAGAPLVFCPALLPDKQKISSKGIMDLGQSMGIDSMIDAYFSGVPMEDILA